MSGEFKGWDLWVGNRCIIGNLTTPVPRAGEVVFVALQGRGGIATPYEVTALHWSVSVELPDLMTQPPTPGARRVSVEVHAKPAGGVL